MNRELPPFRFLVTGMSPNYGGTESFIYGIYQHLDLTKIQFDFLNVYSTPLAKQDWLISQGASVFSLKLKRHEGLRQYRQGIIDFYQNNASRFSGIYCNVQSLDQLDMAKYAKKFGISCRVVHLHNSGYGYEPGWLTKLIIADNKLHSHRYITAYLAGSQKSISWGFSRSDQKRAILVKQGIELDRFAYSEVKREQFRSFYHLKAGKIYGSAGRFDPQKNQLFLLEVFAEIKKNDPTASFLLAGRGPLEQEIRQKANRLGLGDSFQLINNLNSLDGFYSAIDCFLLPSLFEGFGMVLVEAQDAGLPCLAFQGAIPMEASPFVTFLPQGSSAPRWAEMATSVLAKDRLLQKTSMENLGFSIQNSAQTIQKIFLSQLIQKG